MSHRNRSALFAASALVAAATLTTGAPARGAGTQPGASGAQLEHCRAAVGEAIRVVELDSDDAWMRDVGPTFVVAADGARRGVDWPFNAWGGREGGLYASWQRDAVLENSF